jgi:hypothetical protein
MTCGFIERRPQSVQQGRLVGLYGEKEVPIALADHCGHGWCRAGGIQGDQPSRKIEGGEQSLKGRRFGAHLTHADDTSAAQSFNEMVNLTVPRGAPGPLAVEVHGCVLGHEAAQEVCQVIGLRRPAQRVGARGRVPEIQLATEQIEVRASPIGARIPAAASRDGGQDQDHQQAE